MHNGRAVAESATTIGDGSTSWLRWGLALALLACRPVAAQDQDLDPLLFARSIDGQAAEETDLQARGVQLYRIPLSLRLLEMRGNRWGVRLTFPISVSAIRITSTSDLDRFVKGLGLASIVPGLELEIPIESRLRLRPFAEVGFGNSTEGSRTEVLYGGGVRARFVQPVRRLHLSLGGAAMHRKPETSRETYNGHSTFEAAVDAQWPLGFSIGEQAARGGVYAIGRAFNGLELLREGRHDCAEATMGGRHQLRHRARTPRLEGEAAVDCCRLPVREGCVWRSPLRRVPILMLVLACLLAALERTAGRAVVKGLIERGQPRRLVTS